jgi:hypothetical protein
VRQEPDRLRVRVAVQKPTLEVWALGGGDRAQPLNELRSERVKSGAGV